MADTKFDRPTFAIKAIPSDVSNVSFLGNSVLDNLVSVVVAMGTEVWATKRRMKVMESLLVKKGIAPEMIEKYVPTAEEATAWEKDRDRYIEMTFGALGNEGNLSASAPFPKRG
jgi:hypothetical protein